MGQQVGGGRGWGSRWGVVGGGAAGGGGRGWGSRWGVVGGGAAGGGW